MEVLKEMTTRRRTDLELMPLPEPWQTGVLSGFERFAPNRLCGSLPALPDLAFPLLAGSPHRRFQQLAKRARRRIVTSLVLKDQGHLVQGSPHLNVWGVNVLSQVP